MISNPKGKKFLDFDFNSKDFKNMSKYIKNDEKY